MERGSSQDPGKKSELGEEKTELSRLEEIREKLKSLLEETKSHHSCIPEMVVYVCMQQEPLAKQLSFVFLDLFPLLEENINPLFLSDPQVGVIETDSRGLVFFVRRRKPVQGVDSHAQEDVDVVQDEVVLCAFNKRTKRSISPRSQEALKRDAMRVREWLAKGLGGADSTPEELKRKIAEEVWSFRLPCEIEERQVETPYSTVRLDRRAMKFEVEVKDTEPISFAVEEGSEEKKERRVETLTLPKILVRYQLV